MIDLIKDKTKNSTIPINFVPCGVSINQLNSIPLSPYHKIIILIYVLYAGLWSCTRFTYIS